MNLLNPLFLFVTLLLIVSCKKDKTNEPESVNTPTPVIAPCSLVENMFICPPSVLDSLIYISDTIMENDPDFNVESCHYYIKKKSTNPSLNLHFYFVNEPVTGKYKTSQYDAFLESENHVLMRHDFGGFSLTTTGYDSDTIYVNNEDGIITISFCDLNVHYWGFPTIETFCSTKVTIEK